jgi:hypothetical protein
MITSDKAQYVPRRRSYPTYDQFGLAFPISQVGFSAIGGGSASHGDVGPVLGLQYLHQLNSGLGLGLGFDDTDRSKTDSFGLFPSGVAHVVGESLAFLGVGRYCVTMGDSPLCSRGTGRAPHLED